MTTEVTLAGDLGKPAVTLIERISDAIGGISRPWQIGRVAKAEANAEIVRAEAKLKISELERRAMQRLFREEAKKQENIEAITASAIPLLANNSDPAQLEDDWITKFFESCRSISNEDMQALWARLLASEANSVGSVSRKTIEVLSYLDQADATLFSKITQFSLDQNNKLIAVYDKEQAVYADEGLGFGGLSHLADLGLIQCDFLSGFISNQFNESIQINYHGRLVELTLTGPPYQFSVGNIRLTNAGAQIVQTLPRLFNNKFFDYLVGVWHQKGYSPRIVSIISNQTSPKC